MTKNTPGPWHVKGGVPIGNVNRPYEIVAGPSLLATVLTTNEANAAANAALISAAPDLLKALKGVLELHIAHHNNIIHANARVIIAKAEGKTP